MAHSGNVIQFRRGGEPRQQEPEQERTPPRGPQLENGYMMIANELVEAMAAADLNARQQRIVWAVMRLTYGWGTKMARIQGGDLARLTKFSKNRCHDIVSELLARRVLVRDGSSHSPMGINKHYHEWKSKAPKQAPTPRNRKGGETPQNGVKETPHLGVKETPQDGVASKDRKDRKDITPPSEGGERRAGDSLSDGQEGKPSTPKAKPKLPACPHDDLLALWAEIMPDQRQPTHSLWQGTTRARDMANRWRQGFTLTRNGSDEPLYHDRDSGLEWWARFFRFLRRSDFLMNKCRPFDLPWLCKPANFQKILELNYHEPHELPGGAQ